MIAFWIAPIISIGINSFNIVQQLSVCLKPLPCMHREYTVSTNPAVRQNVGRTNCVHYQMDTPNKNKDRETSDKLLPTLFSPAIADDKRSSGVSGWIWSP